MKQLTGLLIILPVAAVIGYLIVHGANRAGCQTTWERLADPSVIIKKLDLDNAQVTKLNALNSQYEQELRDAHAVHCTACCKVPDAIFSVTSETNDPAAQLVDVMSKAQAKSELATIRYIREINVMLSDNQKKRFVTMVGGCVGRCDMGASCSTMSNPPGGKGSHGGL